jgi:hypothetical protein
MRLVGSKLPPTLYLRNTTVTDFPGSKLFGIQWIEGTVELVFRGEGHGNLGSTKPPREKNITFELLNASEHAVRHVEARWRIEDVDLNELVQTLGPNVRSFDGSKLKLGSKDRATICYLSADMVGPAIPVIDHGVSVQIEAPDAFTNAYCLCALQLAKAHHDKHCQTTVMVEPLEVLENWKIPMTTALVEVSYTQGSKRRTERFEIRAEVWGGTPPLVHKKNNAGGLDWVMAPGITAVVDHVTPLHLSR